MHNYPTRPDGATEDLGHIVQVFLGSSLRCGSEILFVCLIWQNMIQIVHQLILFFELIHQLFVHSPYSILELQFQFLTVKSILGIEGL